MDDNILQNREIVFHGIGTDVLKYISIMENGIISKNKATERNIPLSKKI